MFCLWFCFWGLGFLPVSDGLLKKTCELFVGVLTGKENDDPGSSRQYFVLALSTVVVAVAVG